MANKLAKFGLQYGRNEKAEWNKATNTLVEKLSKSHKEAERFVTESIEFLSLTEKNIGTLRKQNVLQKFGGWFTGTNNRLRDENVWSIAKAQQSTMEVIKSLGEMNCLLMDTIRGVTSAINWFRWEDIKMRKNLINIFKTINQRFKENESDIEVIIENIRALEAKVDKVTDDVRVLGWVNRARVMAKTDYKEFTVMRKILESIKSFFEVKPGYWSSFDLDQFCTALCDFGLEPTTKWKIKEIVGALLSELIGKRGFQMSEIVHGEVKPALPLLETVNYIETGEPELVWDAIKDTQQVAENEFLISYLCKRLEKNYGIDPEQEINLHDFAIMLLQNIRLEEEGKKRVITKRKEIPEEKKEETQKIKMGLDEGFKYLEDKDYISAKEFFESRLREQPDNVEILVALGRTYLELEKYKKATKHFKKAIKLNPEHVEAYLGLGRIYLGLSKLDEAVKYYEKAVELAPENADQLAYAYGIQALHLYATLNRKKNAIESLKRAAELNCKAVELIAEQKIEVESTKYAEIKFDADEDDILIGHTKVISEVSDLDINIWLVDEENFKRFSQGKDYICLKRVSKKKVRSHYFCVTLPESKIYYFVLDNKYSVFKSKPILVELVKVKLNWKA